MHPDRDRDESGRDFRSYHRSEGGRDSSARGTTLAHHPRPSGLQNLEIDPPLAARHFYPLQGLVPEGPQSSVVLRSRFPRHEIVDSAVGLWSLLARQLLLLGFWYTKGWEV